MAPTPEASTVVVTDTATLRSLIREDVDALAEVERDRAFPDRLITSEEAAQYLGLPSSNAVRIKVHRGELRACESVEDCGFASPTSTRPCRHDAATEAQASDRATYVAPAIRKPGA